MVPELSKVHTGVTLNYVGYVIILLCVIASMFLGLTGAAAGMNLDTLVMTTQVLYVIATLAGIMMFVGKLFCLAAPADMPGKAALAVSVAFDVIQYGAQVYLLLIARVRVAPAAFQDLQAYAFAAVLGVLAPCLAFVLFMVYFMGLGEYIQSEDVVKRAKNTLTTFIVLVVLVVGWVAMVLSGFRSVSIGMILGLSVLVLGIMLLIQFGNLLGATRKALAVIGGGYGAEE